MDPLLCGAAVLSRKAVGAQEVLMNNCLRVLLNLSLFVEDQNGPSI